MIDNVNTMYLYKVEWEVKIGELNLKDTYPNPNEVTPKPHISVGVADFHFKYRYWDKINKLMFAHKDVRSIGEWSRYVNFVCIIFYLSNSFVLICDWLFLFLLCYFFCIRAVEVINICMNFATNSFKIFKKQLQSFGRKIK